MTTTTQALESNIDLLRGLLCEAADLIAQHTQALADAHTHDGVINDRDVQRTIESDADLVSHMRAAANLTAQPATGHSPGRAILQAQGRPFYFLPPFGFADPEAIKQGGAL